MLKVLSDTGPLNYLVLIEEISILPALFGSVSISETVQSELDRTGTPASVRKWIAASPSWLAVRPDVEGWDGDLRSLDDGERATIKLALSSGSDLILMDDRAGVASARARGFAVTGTLGLLDLAARRGLLDLADAFARLQRTSFRYHPDLLSALLAAHRARR